MTYNIISTSISGIKLSEDKKSINIDMTINYGVDGADKIQPSSTGCTIELSLEKGERNTLVEELNMGVTEWFNTNYNNPKE